MSKYYLVASFYNMYTRSYENETIVNLPGVDLSTLQAIDNFTCTHNNSEIISIIEKEMGYQEFNHLAIKYYKTKSSKPTYYKTITNNLLFKKCTLNLVSKKYNIRGQVISALTIPNNKLFIMEKSKLISIIESKDINNFKKIYPYDNVFSRSVIDYMSIIHDNQEEQQQELNLILTEFSRYKTFRGWITSQQTKNYQINNHPQTSKKSLPSQSQIKPKTIITKSIKEHEADYIENFNKDNPISYEEHQTNLYNRAYLEDEDKEEFLEPSELEKMGMYNDSYIENNIYARRKNRY